MKKRKTIQDWAYTEDPEKHFTKLSKAYIKAEERWVNTESLHLEDNLRAMLNTDEVKKRELRILRDYQYAWHELRLWADTWGGKYRKQADSLLGKNMQFKL